MLRENSIAPGKVAQVVGVQVIREQEPVPVVQYTPKNRTRLSPVLLEDITFLRRGLVSHDFDEKDVSTTLREDSFLDEHSKGGAFVGIYEQGRPKFVLCPLTVTPLKEFTENHDTSGLLRNSFVTTIPDMIHYGQSERIEEVLSSEMSATEVVQHLLDQ